MKLLFPPRAFPSFSVLLQQHKNEDSLANSDSLYEISFFYSNRCFKREFTEAVAIRIWEACWANYLTDYFHLFVCLAIIAAYADDVIAQDLRTDEMLLHFSSLGNDFV